MTLITHTLVETHLLAVDPHLIVLLFLREQAICLHTGADVSLRRWDGQLLSVFEFVRFDGDVSVQGICELSILVDLVHQGVLQLDSQLTYLSASHLLESYILVGLRRILTLGITQSEVFALFRLLHQEFDLLPVAHRSGVALSRVENVYSLIVLSPSAHV